MLVAPDGWLARFESVPGRFARSDSIGRVTALRNLRAFVLGFRDGWSQPTDLGSSYNVDHLDDGRGSAFEWLDRGINMGQFARAGRGSQSWEGRYWPFA